MPENLFLPRELSLLSDYNLLETLLEYRSHLYLLMGTRTKPEHVLRGQIHDALQVIEQELSARGLDVPRRRAAGRASGRRTGAGTRLTD